MVAAGEGEEGVVWLLVEEGVEEEAWLLEEAEEEA